MSIRQSISKNERLLAGCQASVGIPTVAAQVSNRNGVTGTSCGVARGLLNALSSQWILGIKNFPHIDDGRGTAPNLNLGGTGLKVRIIRVDSQIPAAIWD